jgi:transposase InsO family protein
MADWARHRVALAFIPPGEPWRNGYVESFNSRVRDECLDINIFWSLVQARVMISDRKEEFNHHRRHSALGYLPPVRCAIACTRGAPARCRFGDGDGQVEVLNDLPK